MICRRKIASAAGGIALLAAAQSAWEEVGMLRTWLLTPVDARTPERTWAKGKTDLKEELLSSESVFV